MPGSHHNIIHIIGLAYAGYLKLKDMDIIKKYNMKQFAARIWYTPAVHSLIMAAIGAVAGALYPFITAWLNAQPVPDIKVILLTAIKAGVGAALAYLLKNGFLGASGPAVILPPPADNSAPVQIGPGGIAQKGKAV